jgi:hypothetical protein
MAKTKPVKWSLGGNEPDDLGEFKDNETIIAENKGLPTKGVYTFKVKRLGVKPNKNGDDRIAALLEMAEPKKSKGAAWNGYGLWDGFNVTDQGAPFIKRFLKGLGLSWSDFIERTKEDGQEPRQIVQIGKVKFGELASQDPTIRVLVRHAPADDYTTYEHLEVQRYIPAEDEVEVEEEDEDEDVAVMEDDDDDEEVDIDLEDEDEDEDEDEEEDEDDDEDEEDEEDEEEIPSLEDLSAMKKSQLRTLAEENEISAKAIKKAGDKAGLVELLRKHYNLPPF